MRVRALQFVLNHNWDFVAEEVHVQWDNSCLEDLECWLVKARL